MNLDNIISGRLPFNLPHLKDIILVIPTKKDLILHQLAVEKFTEGIVEEYEKAGYKYHEVDAEKDLLKLHPDFYEVMEEANKKRNDILLSLSPSETPDERFLKTPDEVEKMSPEEREKYEKYYNDQFAKLYDKYIEDKAIKKSTNYLIDKVKLYSKTIEHAINENRKIYWLVVTAQKKDGSLYFKNAQSGYDVIISLPYPEYSRLMETWSGILEGVDFPF